MSFWRVPLDAGQQEVVVSKVNILAYRCKGCKYCIEFCPKGVLAEHKDFNEKGYHYPYVVDPEKCKNCTYCETVCPEFAIYVTEEYKKALEPKHVLGEEAPTARRRRRREE